MKKPMILFLTAIIIASTSFGCIAYADDTAVVTSTPVIRLTLEEAQAMAIANSVAYQNQDSTISDALQSYYDTADSTYRSTGSGFMGYFNATITPDVNLDSAANGVKAARLDKENIKRTSDLNVKLSFLKIMKAQYALDDATNNIYLKQKDFDSAKIKCSLGFMTQDELKTYEKAYNDAVSDQDTALKNLHQELQTLNKYIGRNLTDYNIELVMNLATVDINSVDIDKIREANIKNNKSFYTAEQKVEVAKRKYDLTKERYDHFEELGVQNSKQDMLDALSDAERDYNNAKSAFEDSTKDLDMDLNSKYNSLKNSVESIEKLYRDIADYQSDLAKLKIKYDMGLVSKVDYEKQEMGLKTMQNKLNSAIVDQNTLYANLMQYVDPVETASK